MVSFEKLHHPGACMPVAASSGWRDKSRGFVLLVVVMHLQCGACVPWLLPQSQPLMVLRFPDDGSAKGCIAHVKSESALHCSKSFVLHPQQQHRSCCSAAVDMFCEGCRAILKGLATDCFYSQALRCCLVSCLYAEMYRAYRMRNHQQQQQRAQQAGASDAQSAAPSGNGGA